MTMIEIMVVIGIISMMIVVGGTRLGGSGRDMKQAIRRFSVLGKDLHNKAKLFNKTYRIVIQIDEEKEHQYWVESSTDEVKLASEETQKELEKLTKLQREGLVKDYGFTLDAQVTKRRITLPSPLRIKKVEFATRAPVEDGIVYIHFFPQGLIEEAAIHLTDGKKLNWTVAYHPVTGKADLIAKDIPLKDLRGYEE